MAFIPLKGSLELLADIDCILRSAATYVSPMATERMRCRRGGLRLIIVSVLFALMPMLCFMCGGLLLWTVGDKVTPARPQLQVRTAAAGRVHFAAAVATEYASMARMRRMLFPPISFAEAASSMLQNITGGSFFSHTIEFDSSDPEFAPGAPPFFLTIASATFGGPFTLRSVEGGGELMRTTLVISRSIFEADVFIEDSLILAEGSTLSFLDCSIAASLDASATFAGSGVGLFLTNLSAPRPSSPSIVVESAYFVAGAQLLIRGAHIATLALTALRLSAGAPLTGGSAYVIQNSHFELLDNGGTFGSQGVVFLANELTIGDNGRVIIENTTIVGSPSEEALLAVGAKIAAGGVLIVTGDSNFTASGTPRGGRPSANKCFDIDGLSSGAVRIAESVTIRCPRQSFFPRRYHVARFECCAGRGCFC